MVLWTTPMEKWLILILYLTTVWWQLHYSCFKRAWVQLRAIFSHINGGQKKADKLLSQKMPMNKRFQVLLCVKGDCVCLLSGYYPIAPRYFCYHPRHWPPKICRIMIATIFADKKKRQGGKQYCFSASFIYSMEIFHRIYRNSFGY